MKKFFILLKKLFSQYRMTVIRSIINALTVAAIFSWLPTIYKFKSLEIGEYPEEPAEIISERLHEMMPVIITEALIKFLLFALVFFIIFLIYWFKRDYNINLVQKFRFKIFGKV